MATPASAADVHGGSEASVGALVLDDVGGGTGGTATAVGSGGRSSVTDFTGSSCAGAGSVARDPGSTATRGSWGTGFGRGRLAPGWVSAARRPRSTSGYGTGAATGRTTASAGN